MPAATPNALPIVSSEKSTKGISSCLTAIDKSSILSSNPNSLHMR